MRPSLPGPRTATRRRGERLGAGAGAEPRLVHPSRAAYSGDLGTRPHGEIWADSRSGERTGPRKTSRRRLSSCLSLGEDAAALPQAAPAPCRYRRHGLASGDEQSHALERTQPLHGRVHRRGGGTARRVRRARLLAHGPGAAPGGAAPDRGAGHRRARGPAPAHGGGAHPHPRLRRVGRLLPRGPRRRPRVGARQRRRLGAHERRHQRGRGVRPPGRRGGARRRQHLGPPLAAGSWCRPPAAARPAPTSPTWTAASTCCRPRRSSPRPTRRVRREWWSSGRRSPTPSSRASTGSPAGRAGWPSTPTARSRPRPAHPRAVRARPRCP